MHLMWVLSGVALLGLVVAAINRKRRGARQIKHYPNASFGEDF